MTEAIKQKITRLRTEIAFLKGDEAIGGSDRKAEIDAIRKQIRELECQE